MAGMAMEGLRTAEATERGETDKERRDRIDNLADLISIDDHIEANTLGNAAQELADIRQTAAEHRSIASRLDDTATAIRTHLRFVADRDEQQLKKASEEAANLPRTIHG